MVGVVADDIGKFSMVIGDARESPVRAEIHGGSGRWSVGETRRLVDS